MNEAALRYRYRRMGYVFRMSPTDNALSIEPGDKLGHYFIAGEIDLTTARLMDTISDLPWSRGSPALVLDMSEVTFIDSLGISALAGLAGRAPGQTLVIAAPSATLRAVLKISALDQLPGILIEEAA